MSSDQIELRPEAREVQDALADPRVGDVFHEMYSYGVQVLCVDDTHVAWRSFSSKEIARGWETREKWAESFRYEAIPHSRTMMLQRRGEATS